MTCRLSVRSGTKLGTDSGGLGSRNNSITGKRLASCSCCCSSTWTREMVRWCSASTKLCRYATKNWAPRFGTYHRAKSARHAGADRGLLGNDGGLRGNDGIAGMTRFEGLQSLKRDCRDHISPPDAICPKMPLDGISAFHSMADSLVSRFNAGYGSDGVWWRTALDACARP